MDSSIYFFLHSNDAAESPVSWWGTLPQIMQDSPPGNQKGTSTVKRIGQGPGDAWNHKLHPHQMGLPYHRPKSIQPEPQAPSVLVGHYRT